MSGKYEMIIYRNGADHASIAEVPELSGCMADGGNYQEAVSNAEIVVGEWVVTVAELGREIPVPKGRLVYA